MEDERITLDVQCMVTVFVQRDRTMVSMVIKHLDRGFLVTKQIYIVLYCIVLYGY